MEGVLIGVAGIIKEEGIDLFVVLCEGVDVLEGGAEGGSVLIFQGEDVEAEGAQPYGERAEIAC